MRCHRVSSLIIVSLCSMFSACSYIAPYPGECGQRITTPDNNCPNISGIYFNSGPDQNSNTNYLYDKIASEGIVGTHECTDCPVLIQWIGSNHNVLLIQLLKYSIRKDWNVEAEKTLKRSKSDFICSKGRLKSNLKKEPKKLLKESSVRVLEDSI